MVRLNTRPKAPTAIRIQPTMSRSSQPTRTLNANVMIAPMASKKTLAPMPMAVLLELRVVSLRAYPIGGAVTPLAQKWPGTQGSGGPWTRWGPTGPPDPVVRMESQVFRRNAPPEDLRPSGMALGLRRGPGPATREDLRQRCRGGRVIAGQPGRDKVLRGLGARGVVADLLVGRVGGRLRGLGVLLGLGQRRVLRLDGLVELLDLRGLVRDLLVRGLLGVVVQVTGRPGGDEEQHREEGPDRTGLALLDDG